MLPLPEETIQSLRAELTDHRGAVETADGSETLVIRSPRDSPDIVADIEDAVVYLDADDALADTVLLAGGSSVTKVDPKVLRRKLDDREDEDAKLVEQVRPLLEDPYDWTLFRGGTRRDILRAAVQVPHLSATDLAGEDLPALKRNLAPLNGTPKGRELDVVYVLGDDDHVRLDAERFFGDLRAATEKETEPPEPTSVLVQRLSGAGYTIVQGHDRRDVDLTAEGDDRTIAVRVVDTLDRGDVQRFLTVAETVGADVFVAVASAPSTAARRTALGTRVEIVAPDEVGDLAV